MVNEKEEVAIGIYRWNKSYQAEITRKHIKTMALERNPRERLNGHGYDWQYLSQGFSPTLSEQTHKRMGVLFVWDAGDGIQPSTYKCSITELLSPSRGSKINLEMERKSIDS